MIEAEQTVERTISSVQPGEHLCCIIADEPQRRAILARYLAGGLAQRQQVRCLYAEQMPPAVQAFLAEAGVDTAQAALTGQLHFDAGFSLFGTPDRFDPPGLLARLRAWTDQAMAEGYAALRVMLDMSWAAGVRPGTSAAARLEEFENQLSLPGAFPHTIFLCQYDRGLFDPALLQEILSVHPVLADDGLLFTNPFYIAPVLYGSASRESARLDLLLRAISNRQQMEWQIERVRAGLETQSGDQSSTLAHASQELTREILQRQGAEDALASAHAALLETENRYRTIFNAATEAIYILDIQGRFLEVNSVACERLEYPTEALVGQPASVIEAPELGGQLAVRIGLLQEYGVISFETVHVTRSGEMVPVEVNARLIDYAGRPAILNIARDITERKHAELALVNMNQALADANEALETSNAALRESVLKFSSLVTSSPDGVALVDETGRVIEFNAALETIVGVPAGDVLGMTLAGLYRQTMPPGSRQDAVYAVVARGLERALRTGKADWLGKVIDHQIIRADGQPRFVQTICFPLRTERGVMIGLVTRDVTAHRRAEKELEQYRQNLEKMVSERTAQLQHEIRVRQQAEDNMAVMLREIHHRVKNNLNVIIALIDLQKGTQSDPQVLQVFKELQTRAYTMALVHESLYRSPNLAQVDFSSYLRTLIAYLQAAYSPTGRSMPVQFIVEAADVALAIETAIPCGLIVNELVTNALKYAFPARVERGDPREDAIIVRLEREKTVQADTLVLTVQDNGVGLPPGFDWLAATTLGLQLVRVLARQLGGQLEMNAARGTAWRLAFKERK